ncbi:MAG: tRNA uridine-5-carboxymethylaminomethyl(34) synthesis GTPase MnmE [Clostridia bacterium]|nr:tRNA uridine-5-carboxymethylaminomethyl(34) synthesis GTPase MnmE [Clostridia bacterium]
MDTIVAIATSTAAKAGVNIIRLSGGGALSTAKSVFFSQALKAAEMAPNMMYLGTVRAKTFAEKAFCVYFQDPRSYTGEDVVEFHCHGGQGVANAILRLCVEQGARPALPGEFTKRAFLNGKLSLAEAEGIAAMTNAQSESEILQSYKLLSGEISQGIYAMQSKLIEVLAALEVRLDYPEETADEPNEPQKEKIQAVLDEIERLLDGAKLSKAITDGINVAIVGLPNVGKSSLLNGLVMADRAIVTEYAGTTRDVLSETVDLEGIRFNFLDTAGIRESDNEIEKIGIERTKKTIKSADVVLFVMDMSQPETAEERQLEELLRDKQILRVSNKSDIGKNQRKSSLVIKAKPPRDIECVKNELLKLAGRERIFSTGIITRERHIFCLKEAKNYLRQAISEYDSCPVEISILNIRAACGELAKITGSDVSESIIEEVFSTFCVGK